MSRQVADILSRLPSIWPEDLLGQIREQIARRSKSVVVLDDDPTGTQTVHDVPVLTKWDVQTIAAEFERKTPLFYVLTNSRSLPQQGAVRLAREIGASLSEAARQTHRAFQVISRSDSTLRGHYPAEVDALAESLGMGQPACLLIPFFEEGGRYTIDDVHYVQEGDCLVPAGETAFASDVVFGYRNSNLRFWVQEKTRGRVAASSVQSLSLSGIRTGGPQYVERQIAALRPGSVCIVNAADYRDLEAVTLGLVRNQPEGVRLLFRTAASFVRVRAGLAPRPLLTAAELPMPRGSGGLILVGSHVPRSSEQLACLLDSGPVQSTQLDAERLLSPEPREKEIRRAVRLVESTLSHGEDVVVYTSRRLIRGGSDEESLSVGRTISQSIVEVVRRVTVVPRYILAKGGITSSDIATRALGIVRARVLGQILPGVPVWQSGREGKFPGLPYIVFPGNVGAPDAIATVVHRLREGAR